MTKYKTEEPSNSGDGPLVYMQRKGEKKCSGLQYVMMIVFLQKN